MTTASSDDEDGFGNRWNVFEDEEVPQRDVAPVAVAAVEETEAILDVEIEHHAIKLSVLRRPGQPLAMRVWHSTLLMCKYMPLRFQTDVVGKDVLEVGAGIGLCGLMAVSMGARSVTLTDANKSSHELLAKQVALNFGSKECVKSPSPESFLSPSSAHSDLIDSQFTMYAPQVAIRRLLWEDDQAREETQPLPHHWSNIDSGGGPELEEGLQFDLLIGSDVLYFQPQIQALVAVICTRLRPGGVALMHLPVRNKGARLPDDFKNALLLRGWTVMVDEFRGLDEVAEANTQWDIVNETSTCTGYRLFRFVRPLP